MAHSNAVVLVLMAMCLFSAVTARSPIPTSSPPTQTPSAEWSKNPPAAAPSPTANVSPPTSPPPSWWSSPSPSVAPSWTSSPPSEAPAPSENGAVSNSFAVFGSVTIGLVAAVFTM